MKNITAPVYGFYAGNDARISATIPATTEAMKAAGKTYDPVVYDGAGHGFMRAGQAPDANDANKKAWEQGFAKITSLIDKGGSAAAGPGLGKPAPAGQPMGAPAISMEPAIASMDCHGGAHSTNSEMAALISK
jgi:carboxymethylenebutenolidase